METCPKSKEVDIVVDGRKVKLDICEVMLKPVFNAHSEYAPNPVCSIKGKKIEECRFNQSEKGS